MGGQHSSPADINKQHLRHQQQRKQHRQRHLQRGPDHHNQQRPKTEPAAGGDIVRGYKQDIPVQSSHHVTNDTATTPNSHQGASAGKLEGPHTAHINITNSPTVEEKSFDSVSHSSEDPYTYDNNFGFREPQEHQTPQQPQLPPKRRDSHQNQNAIPHKVTSDSITAQHHHLGSAVPNDDEVKMNTIRQAKVNVKDRITMFAESGGPILPAKSGNPYKHRNTVMEDNSPNSKSSDAVPLLPPKQRSIKSQSMLNEPRPVITINPRARGEDSESDSGNEIAVTADQPRRTSEPAILPLKSQASKKLGVKAEMTRHLEEPPIDYNNDDEGPSKPQRPAYHRMNTLEYFKQMPRDPVLKNFDKPKSAAMQKKAKSPKARPAAAARPQSAILTADAHLLGLGTERDIAGGSQDLTSAYADIIGSDENLGDTNKHGQKYAMDDAAYETLSRRKKITGQRLPVGFVDKETEKNFLHSLKRNIQLKQARNSPHNDPDLRQRQPVRLSEMVF